jgi:hypothetical protein
VIKLGTSSIGPEQTTVGRRRKARCVPMPSRRKMPIDLQAIQFNGITWALLSAADDSDENPDHIWSML